jgi:fucose 4-O-acetylase-like acetyltransferase
LNSNNDNSSRKAYLDATKGILISLVVLGHNYFFSRFFVEWFSFLYNFHVACFLLFSFLLRYEELSVDSYVTRVFRALVPQFVFLILVIPTYYVMFVSGLPEETGKWFSRLPLALTLQTETQLDMVTGFRHFWFLPAMTLLVSLLWILDGNRARAASILVFSLVLWHSYAGELNASLFQYFPWGAALVGFIFVPGLIARKIYNWPELCWEHFPIHRDLLLFSAWLVCAWIVMRYRLFMPLAGDPDGLVSGLAKPGRLLFHDLFLLVSFFTILRLGWWLRKTFLVSLGRESLKIFLLSPLVWQLFWLMGGRNLEAGTYFEKSISVLITYIGTLAVSYWLAKLIAGTPLQSIMFPRTPADWRTLRR